MHAVPLLGDQADDLPLATTALAESRFRALLEALPEAVLIVDEAGHVTFANRQVQAAFGYTPEELRGRPLAALLPALLDDWNGAPGVLYGRRKDGGEFSAEVTHSSIEADGGARAIVTIRDVTERKQAEQALREREERLRTLWEHTTDLVRIVDGAGVIRYASPSHEHVLGHAPTALLGSNVFDLIHPDDVAQVVAAYDAAIRDSAVAARVEARFQHADGSWRIMEISGNNRLNDPAVRGIIVSARDVTARKQAERVLRESEERLRTLVEAAPVGMCIVDEQGVYESVNAAYCAIYGYTREELVGRHFTIVVPEPVRATMAERFTRYVATRSVSQQEVAVVSKDGQSFTVLSTSVPIASSDGRARNAFFTIDITHHKRTEAYLTHLAHHDMLTGLPNRVLFHDRLEQALAKARRSDHLVALLFLDLDDFKAINDTLGHAAGDALLQAIACYLPTCVRESDTVARLAGDEFTIILPDAGGDDNAAAVARKILDGLAAGFVVGEHNLTLSASIGISLYPCHGSDGASLLRSADAAMYQAKGQGKNTYATISHQLSAVSRQLGLDPEALDTATAAGTLLADS